MVRCHPRSPQVSIRPTLMRRNYQMREMRRVEGVNWIRTAGRLQDEAALTFLTFLLAVAVSVLGLQTKLTWLLSLTKLIVVVVALLEIGVALTAAYLVLMAWRYVRRHWRLVRSPMASSLRTAVRRAALASFHMWATALAVVVLPFVIDVVKKVPEFGMVYSFLLLMLGAQWLFLRPYRDLAEAVDESLRMRHVRVIKV